MVHVKHGLAALEQYGLALVSALFNTKGIGNVRASDVHRLKRLVGECSFINRTTIVQFDQHLILLMQARLYLSCDSTAG